MTRARTIHVGALALLLVAALFLLAACGEEEVATTTTETAVPPVEEETTTTTEAMTDTTDPGLGFMGPVVIDLTGDEVDPPVDTEASGTFTLDRADGAAGDQGTTTTDGVGTDDATTTTDGVGTDDGTTTTDGVGTDNGTMGQTTTTQMGTTGDTGTDGTQDGTGTGTAGMGTFDNLRWTLELEDIEDVTEAHIYLEREAVEEREDGATGDNGVTTTTQFGDDANGDDGVTGDTNGTTTTNGDGRTTTTNGVGDDNGLLDLNGQDDYVVYTLFDGPTREGPFSGVLAEGILNLNNLELPEGMTQEQVWMAIQQGRAYVQVHTSENPEGELRGQLEFDQTGGGTTTTTDGLDLDDDEDDDDLDDTNGTNGFGGTTTTT
jgi:hypothetical protein